MHLIIQTALQDCSYHKVDNLKSNIIAKKNISKYFINTKEHPLKESIILANFIPVMEFPWGKFGCTGLM